MDGCQFIRHSLSLDETKDPYRVHYNAVPMLLPAKKMTSQIPRNERMTRSVKKTVIYALLCRRRG